MKMKIENIVQGGCCGQGANWPPLWGRYDNWRAAVLDACVMAGTKWDEMDAPGTLARLIDWHVKVALDPRVSNDVRLPVRAPGEHAAMPQDEDGGYPDWW